MAQFSIYDMDQLKNVNEKRVWNLLSQYLDTVPSNVCQCNLCIVDMAAITLNNIKPCYQFEENIPAAQQVVPDEEILNQIAVAVSVVASSPHH